jgi:hypothetical protein
VRTKPVQRTYQNRNPEVGDPLEGYSHAVPKTPDGLDAIIADELVADERRISYYYVELLVSFGAPTDYVSQLKADIERSRPTGQGDFSELLRIYLDSREASDVLA